MIHLLVSSAAVRLTRIDTPEVEDPEGSDGPCGNALSGRLSSHCSLLLSQGGHYEMWGCCLAFDDQTHHTTSCFIIHDHIYRLYYKWQCQSDFFS